MWQLGIPAQDVDRAQPPIVAGRAPAPCPKSAVPLRNSHRYASLNSHPGWAALQASQGKNQRSGSLAKSLRLIPPAKSQWSSRPGKNPRSNRLRKNQWSSRRAKNQWSNRLRKNHWSNRPAKDPSNHPKKNQPTSGSSRPPASGTSRSPPTHPWIRAPLRSCTHWLKRCRRSRALVTGPRSTPRAGRCQSTPCPQPSPRCVSSSSTRHRLRCKRLGPPFRCLRTRSRPLAPTSIWWSGSRALTGCGSSGVWKRSAKPGRPLGEARWTM